MRFRARRNGPSRRAASKNRRPRLWTDRYSLIAAMWFPHSGRRTEELDWTMSLASGDGGSPAVGENGIYVNFPCQYYGLASGTGKVLWHDDFTAGEGEYLYKLTAYYNGKVYVRDPTKGAFILDASSGAVDGTFSSQLAPSFFTSGGVTYGVSVMSGSLNSASMHATGTTRWVFDGDGNLSTSPLIVGKYVVEGSSKGNPLCPEQGENGRIGLVDQWGHGRFHAPRGTGGPAVAWVGHGCRSSGCAGR